VYSWAPSCGLTDGVLVEDVESKMVGGRMAEKSAKKKMEDRKGVEGEVRS
jgi:hypothetical protein